MSTKPLDIFRKKVYNVTMEYDSTHDTKAHIAVVGENIDRICDRILCANSADINAPTLVDFLQCFLATGAAAKHHDPILHNIAENTVAGNYNITDDILVAELQHRKNEHDRSKLQEPEKSYFDAETPKLKSLVFGTPEYEASLNRLRIALDHHYSINRHHPEHFKNGVSDMNVIDIVEMFCDWDASTKRLSHSPIHRGVEINRKRFGLSEDVTKMFHVTAAKIFGE